MARGECSTMEDIPTSRHPPSHLLDTLTPQICSKFVSTFLQRLMKGQMNVGELTQEDERKPMCLRFSTLFFLLVCSRPCPADYAALAPNARQSNSHLSPTCSSAQQPALLILGCWYCNQVHAKAQVQVLARISSTWQLVTGTGTDTGTL